MTEAPAPPHSPWNTAVQPITLPRGDVTMVEEQTFCISDRCGNMAPNAPQGLFVLDKRVLSRFEMRINGHGLEPLAVVASEPFAATFAVRGAPASGSPDAHVVAFRTRHIGRGMRERITMTNYGIDSTSVEVQLVFDADFASVFEVKESRVEARETHRRVAADTMVFEDAGATNDGRRTATLRFEPPAAVEPDRATWHCDLDAGETWELCVELTIAIHGDAVPPRFRCGANDAANSVPEKRLAAWRARMPVVSTDSHALSTSVARAGEDLGALRIFDPDHPDLAIVAAGAPWFMTVFGRDSLLTAWMALIADPSLAAGVLETLARFQGREVDDATDEEPGKILHEMRFGAAGGLALGGDDIYYGSIDATPLFVMLLGEVRRWGLADELVDRLLPHADRALEWIEQFGDRDGDGYVEYQRRSEAGLANQGWKDSWDSIRFADGTLAEPPIALCEVQGYVYAAYLARAHFAAEAGDERVYRTYVERAADLRRRFNEDFWLDEQGTYALALDGRKRPIDAIASNVGHCLWTGVVDVERAPAVADRLLASDMFSGWGVRTLAESMTAYNPVSYHNGSVWPHDNALCASGLTRYGLVDHAHRILEGQLAAAEAHDGRLPELFAGFSRAELAVPGAYPASCSPQAWASASPLLWLRTMLQLAPWITHDRLWVQPSLPPGMQRLSVHNIAIGDTQLDIDVEAGETDVTISEPQIEVIRRRRAPSTAVLDEPST